MSLYPQSSRSDHTNRSEGSDVPQYTGSGPVVPTPVMDLLSGRTVRVPAGAGARGEFKKSVGSRYNNTLNTKLIGRKTTIYEFGQKARIYISRAAKSPEYLTSLANSRASRVVVHEIKARPPVLRRANVSPAKALQLDDAIIDLLIQAVFVEKALARQAHAKYLQSTRASSSWSTLADTPIFFRREGLGLHFGVPDHVISQCFERLNKRGLLSAESNRPAHDSSRHNWGGTDSGWTGSTRYINVEKLSELIEPGRMNPGAGITGNGPGIPEKSPKSNKRLAP